MIKELSNADANRAFLSRTLKADVPLRPATAETISARGPPAPSTSSLKRPRTAIEASTSGRVKHRHDFARAALATHSEESDTAPDVRGTVSVSSPFPSQAVRQPFPSMASAPIWDERYTSGRAFSDVRPATGTSANGEEGSRQFARSCSSYRFEGYERPPSQPYTLAPDAMGPPRRPSFSQNSPTSRHSSDMRGPPTFEHLPPQQQQQRYPDSSDTFRPPSSGLPYPRSLGAGRPNVGSGTKITLPSLAAMIGPVSFGVPPPQPYRPSSSSGYPYAPTKMLAQPDPLYSSQYNGSIAAAFEAKYGPLNPHTSVPSAEDARYYD